MKFENRLQPAIFVRRYKRFLVDVVLPGGEEITVHCPNTGSMTGCVTPGCEVLLSHSDNPKRKYPFSLEMTKPGSCWVGVNTMRTNYLVKEALLGGVITEFGKICDLRAEVKVSAASRLDFLVTNDDGNVYLEVKNCTLVEDGVAMFPDAKTARGTKHLNELMTLKEMGHGAAVLFCVQRSDAKSFAPAWMYDKLYSETLLEAAKVGVVVCVYQADVGPEGVDIVRPLPTQNMEILAKT